MENSIEPKKILFFRFDSRVGDCVVHSFVIRELKKLFPKSHLTVATFAPSEVFFQNSPYIDELIVLPNISKGYIRPSVLWALFKMLWHSYTSGYDYVIPNPVLPTWRNRFYCHLLPRTRIPVFDYTQHITYSYKQFLEQFADKKVSSNYELVVSTTSIQKANAFIEQHRLSAHKWVIVNPTGSSAQRDLSAEQIQTILSFLTSNNYQPVLLDYKHQFNGSFKDTILCESQNILEVAALIERSSAVITVDTGIVHLSDAFGKPMLVLYGNDKYGTLHNHIFWASIQPTTKTLQSQNRISDISLDTLQQTLTNFLPR